MSVQNRTDFTNHVLVLEGGTKVRDNETLLTDAGRAAPLLKHTVMAQVAATKKWVPLTDVAAVTGACTARGIYLGEDITAAALVAGDVLACPIMVGGFCNVDASMLVLENALTVNSVVGAASVNARRIEDDLARIGIFLESVIDIDGFVL